MHSVNICSYLSNLFMLTLFDMSFIKNYNIYLLLIKQLPKLKLVYRSFFRNAQPIHFPQYSRYFHSQFTIHVLPIHRLHLLFISIIMNFVLFSILLLGLILRNSHYFLLVIDFLMIRVILLCLFAWMGSLFCFGRMGNCYYHFCSFFKKNIMFQVILVTHQIIRLCRYLHKCHPLLYLQHSFILSAFLLRGLLYSSY